MASSCQSISLRILDEIYPGLVEIVSKNPHFQPDLEFPIIRILRVLEHMKNREYFYQIVPNILRITLKILKKKFLKFEL